MSDIILFIMSQKKKFLDLLETQGASSSPEIQAYLGVSQATVSRLMVEVEDEVIVCGKGKATKYALAQPIGLEPAQQPIWMISQDGFPVRLGTLSLLGKSQIHIEADGVNHLFTSSQNEVLPWYLSPLKAQGFLGRLLAQKLSPFGVTPNPDTWGAEAALIGCLHTHDAPGAILLGHDVSGAPKSVARIPAENIAQTLDAITADLAKILPLGSSAGGDQPKFLAVNDKNLPVLVKFSPPIGTPYGDRWGDLLRMEVLSNDVLASYGFDTANNEFVQTQTRSYLVSKRFDRVGINGRVHVVSLGAVHQCFVKGAYVNWAATCDALVRQGRLPRLDAEKVHAIFQFGKLIGNSDMHFGNASLFVEGHTLAQLAKAKFKLAPVYDMLPMRWRPDQMMGVNDYAPFEVDYSLADENARNAARDFWHAVSADQYTSRQLKAVALVMTNKMGCSQPAPDR
jgi:hypothetical protein